MVAGGSSWLNWWDKWEANHFEIYITQIIKEIIVPVPVAEALCKLKWHPASTVNTQFAGEVENFKYPPSLSPWIHSWTEQFPAFLCEDGICFYCVNMKHKQQLNIKEGATTTDLKMSIIPL